MFFESLIWKENSSFTKKKCVKRKQTGRLRLVFTSDGVRVEVVVGVIRELMA